MDSTAGGSAPDPYDPFRSSPRLSRSPTRGVGNPMQRAENTVPLVARGEQAGPQLPKTSVCSAVAQLEIQAPITSNIVTSQKTMDQISVPSHKAATKSPSGSPHRSLDLTTALQNEDLRSILVRMNGKINILLAAFETQRHVTKETKGTVMDLSALSNRSIELQEATDHKPPPKSTATQTEAQKHKRSQLETTKQTKSRAQVPKAGNSIPVATSTGALNTAKESKPVSYASVTKVDSNAGEWAIAKPKRLRKKPEAFILKKTGEVTYADMLRKMKTDPSLSEFGKQVRKIRRTQQGELLLEIKGNASTNVPKFRGELEATLKDLASVRTGAQRTALICSGLDEATSAEDLHSSLVSQFPGILLQPEDVKGLRRMRDGTQVASLLMSANDAIAVIKRGAVTVGWSRCRIIQDVRPTKCYRCLGYGHRAANCKAPDRSDCCLRCGEKGHKAKGCNAPPKCLICSSDVDQNHMTGGYSCPTYKACVKGVNGQHNGPN